MRNTQEHRQRLEVWLREHKGLIVRIAGLYTNTAEDRADLFQEILLQLWVSLPSFRQESKASTWIYRVALNTALTWRRIDQKRRPPHDIFLMETEAACPFESLEKQEQVEWLRREIQQLQESDRSVMLLYLEGVNYQEMAEILGISQSNVGVRLTRIRKRLAEKVGSANNET